MGVGLVNEDVEYVLRLLSGEAGLPGGIYFFSGFQYCKKSEK